MFIKFTITRSEDETGFADVDTRIDLLEMTREQALWVAACFENIATALEKGSTRDQVGKWTRHDDE